jgi:parallel beta-helix repeat protein
MKDLSPIQVNEQVYNVKSYGAKGDDASADHVGIQAALDAAFNAGGGQVVIPKGIYRIYTTPLKIRSGVRVTCLPGAEIHRYGNPGGASMIWNGDSGQNRAGWTGHGNFIVEGGVWDMRCSNSTTALSNDDFTRANTSQPHTLGVMTSGQTWIDETSRGTSDQGTGCLGITSNTAYAPVAQSGGNISTVFGWDDGSVQVDLSTVGIGSGVIFRLKDSQNYWQYIRNASGNAELSAVIGGVTQTAVTPTATTAVANGNTLKVIFYGNTIKCYVIASGVYTLTHDTTDTAGFNNNRKVGITIPDTTSRLDNFANTSQYWTDVFTRSNSSVSLGSTTTGSQAWTSRTGTHGITSNTAYAPNAGTNISTVPTTSETNVQVQVPTVGKGGVVFRYVDNNNYWSFMRNASGNAELTKVVGGVSTIITPTNITAVAANDTLYVKVCGWTIRTFVNYTAANESAGTWVHETTDSALFQATDVGIITTDTTVRLDNFDCYAASGGYTSGACFNFGHGEGIILRDMTIRDVSAKSHCVEIAGCKNVLATNVTFAGMSPVTGRQSEAFQMDITKSTSYFGAFGPHDSTFNRDVVVSGCSFVSSYMPGTTAWTRGVGSHSGTVGAWHDRLRVIDNYFDVIERAVRAYNWNNVIIQGNNVNSGWGVEIRPIWTSDTSDTLNLAGTQTSASQLIQGMVVANNTFNVGSSTAGSNDFVIRVFGETTGRIASVAITGNVIKSGASGGIIAEFCDHVTLSGNSVANMTLRGVYVKDSTDVSCSGNTIYNTSDHALGFKASDGQVTGNNVDTATGSYGIVLDTCADLSVVGNSISQAGKHGIYVLGGSKIRVLNNYIKGSGRLTNATYSHIKADTSPDDVTVGGNCTRQWGSGNEAMWGFHCSTGTNIKRLQNDFAAGTSGDVSVVSTGDLGLVTTTSRTSDLTGLNSTGSFADVTGLTANINATGVPYKFKAFIQFKVVSGTSPGVIFGVTGPTATMFSYNINHQNNGTSGTTVVASTNANNGFATISTYTGNSNLYLSLIEGIILPSATGTIKVQYRATGTSPSITVMTGSTFIVERLIG